MNLELRKNTVMKTNEWISNVPVYEPGKPIEEVARELGFADVTEIIKVASNENELGPSPKALKAMAAAATEMHRYPDGGCFYLKEKLSAKLGVKPQNLLFGNGSNELIEFLGHAYLGPGTNLVMSEGAFVVYRLVAKLFNAQVIAAPMKKFAHDLDAMLAAVTPETRMVIICNPNNPTGTIVSSAKIKAFLKKLPPHVLAVFDEAYFEYMPDDKKPDLIKEIQKGRENVIVLRTFSKAYGLAGLRIGYAVGHEKLIALLNRVRQPFNVNAMAMAAALAAIDDDNHLAKTRKTNFQGLELFAKVFPTIGKGLKFVPSYANFILVKTGNGRQVFKELQKRKVIVRPMDGYGLPDWIRITIGTPAQNRAVLKALKEIL
jgi:histidinol-phosphate aminotransferase